MDNYFMGLDGFVWFTGVVEDRNDPSKLGRVKVRALGFHTEDLNDIPTKDLPWAHVMHPVTDPSMQGMGNSPTFLLEGTWVIGFFRDAREKQQPVIMGTLPGVPSSTPDSSKGFNDPNAIYPNSAIAKSGHTTGESDTNRLARGGVDAETHQSLIDRRDEKVKDIPIANKPNFGAGGVSTLLVAEDERKTWEQPHPQGVEKSASQYPYNHVFESESGHISEVDDTPENERLYREHRTGTFEEIDKDGTRVTRIVKDDYEIVYGDKSVYINGTVNLTTGSCNHLIQGDYTQEVTGNYTLKVGKDMSTKVGALGAGNYVLDVLGGYSYRVADDFKGVVGIGPSGKGDYNVQIKNSESRSVGIDSRTTVVGNATYMSDGSILIIGKLNLLLNQTDTGGTLNIDAGGVLNTRVTGTSTETIGGSVSESYGSLATTISGTTAIKHTGIATYQYSDAFKERIEKDHFVTKITGFTDHSATIDPARATGTTAVTAI